ncbi:MAG: hypothetical protein J0G32_04815 [Alphaproteobacteria bacterium]|nr:hypothetical protein [Alphaproteobacteria bacterium]OJV14065.1 MAG: hypothetical protein BGO27_01080 [Alphaproteobacteria bacterium 33-17]
MAAQLPKKILESLKQAVSKFSPQDKDAIKQYGQKMAGTGMSWQPDPNRDFLSFGYGNDRGQVQSVDSQAKKTQQAR